MSQDSSRGMLGGRKVASSVLSSPAPPGRYYLERRRFLYIPGTASTFDCILLTIFLQSSPLLSFEQKSSHAPCVQFNFSPQFLSSFALRDFWTHDDRRRCGIFHYSSDYLQIGPFLKPPTYFAKLLLTFWEKKNYGLLLT